MNRAARADDLLDTARQLMNEHCDKPTLSVLSGIMAQMRDFTGWPSPYYCDDCGVGLEEPIVVEQLIIGDGALLKAELCAECYQTRKERRTR